MERLKKIILDQRESMEEFFSQRRIIPREKVEEALGFLEYPNILVVVGPKRSGKSVFSYMLGKKITDKFFYVNFFDERLSNFGDFDLLLKAAYQLIGEKIDLFIFDEIQEVKGWKKFLSRLRNNNRIIVTGSNARILGGELSVYLTGRYTKFFLLPFSFREVCRDKIENFWTTKKEALILQCFRDYIFSSGFPEYYLFGKEMVRQILEDILFKDCIYRYNIKNMKSFRELSSVIINQYASQFTYRKLKNVLGVSDLNSVKNYVQYLEESFLIFISYLFSRKAKVKYQTSKKAYVSDLGFANFFAGETSKKESRLLENFVAIELIGSGRDLYFYKTRDGYEVDFVVIDDEKGSELIQVSFSVEEEKTREREIRALLHSKKELGIEKMKIITYDEEGNEEVNWHNMRGKIEYIPAWKWALGK